MYKTGGSLVKELTQGTIIDNCIAENYTNCCICGIIITPRCDLAHSGKVTHVHYLPIVDFEHWYKYDGLLYLWCRKEIRLKKKLEDFCLQKNYPIIQENLMRDMASKINDAKDKNTFSSLIENYFSHAKSNPQTYQPSQDEITKLIENLIGNDIPAFHVIEDWADSKKFKIVLMRDLKRIDFNVAKGIEKSLDEASIKEMWRNDLACSPNKSLIYSMQTTMDSPFIEQLIERFSYNFCRVGVEDICRDDVKLFMQSQIGG